MPLNYDIGQDIWPDKERGRPLAPVRVGMDAETGRVLVGWPHVEQSIRILFVTRYHERVLRRWAGSFVPHMLGRNLVESTVTRFFWAMATSIDLWEPCYRVEYIRVMRPDDPLAGRGAQLTTVEDIRRGQISFQMKGVYMPRGHLGDNTPESQRTVGLIGRGGGQWDLWS